MFKHMSMLFAPREIRDIIPVQFKVEKSEANLDTFAAIHTHIDLCRKTLAIFLSAVQDNGHLFTNKTWDVVLKVSMGICDALLSSPKHIRPKESKHVSGNDDLDKIESASLIGDNLCEILIHV